MAETEPEAWRGFLDKVAATKSKHDAEKDALNAKCLESIIDHNAYASSREQRLTWLAGCALQGGEMIARNAVDVACNVLNMIDAECK